MDQLMDVVVSAVRPVIGMEWLGGRVLLTDRCGQCGPRRSAIDGGACSAATGWLHPTNVGFGRQRGIAHRSVQISQLVDAGALSIHARLKVHFSPLTQRGGVVQELALGGRIRSLRQARRLTLRELAARAGVTESFLSQVEREVASPSIVTVQRIARSLDLSIAQLFAEEHDRAGRASRGARRGRGVPEDPRRGRVPDFEPGRAAAGHPVRDRAGGGTGEEPYTTTPTRFLMVLEGTLDLWVGDEHYVLREGDAIVRSRLPHWNMNRGDTPTSILFCMTPPSF